MERPRVPAHYYGSLQWSNTHLGWHERSCPHWNTPLFGNPLSLKPHSVGANLSCGVGTHSQDGPAGAGPIVEGLSLPADADPIKTAATTIDAIDACIISLAPCWVDDPRECVRIPILGNHTLLGNAKRIRPAERTASPHEPAILTPSRRRIRRRYSLSSG